MTGDSCSTKKHVDHGLPSGSPTATSGSQTAWWLSEPGAHLVGPFLIFGSSSELVVTGCRNLTHLYMPGPSVGGVSWWQPGPQNSLARRLETESPRVHSTGTLEDRGFRRPRHAAHDQHFSVASALGEVLLGRKTPASMPGNPRRGTEMYLFSSTVSNTVSSTSVEVWCPRAICFSGVSSSSWWFRAWPG